MLNKLRTLRNKKGFTLVELIVVLVILAILAAILIPSLSGYVDKANERAAIAEGRSALMAAQTLASEAYAESGTKTEPTAAAVKELAEVTGTVSDITLGGTDGVQVIKLTYTPTKGDAVTYENGAWS